RALQRPVGARRWAWTLNGNTKCKAKCPWLRLASSTLRSNRPHWVSPRDRKACAFVQGRPRPAKAAVIRGRAQFSGSIEPVALCSIGCCRLTTRSRADAPNAARTLNANVSTREHGTRSGQRLQKLPTHSPVVEARVLWVRS